VIKILALDIATATGWAHNLEDSLKLGTWKLSSDTEVRGWNKARMCRRNDPRVGRLYSQLEVYRGKVDAVVFEDVQFQTYTQQCQLWSSLRAAVWLAFEGAALIECVPVTTLKQFATGHGGATKGMMMAAAVRDSNNRFRMKNETSILDTLTNETLDDNAADAYHLFRWAQRNLGRSK
jgi:hypothetical protein